jgi:opacity protein-like surface antigen
MTKLPLIAGITLTLFSMGGLAGTMGPVQPELSPWYLAGSAGYSDSRDANISVDPAIWDNAAQGYSRSLDSTAALGFGVGRYFGNGFRIDVRGERRGDYEYSQLQTGINTGTPGFISDARTRNFKLMSDTLMLSGWLDLGDLFNNLSWQVASFGIQPFVGAGIGANYMEVHDFHTVGTAFGARNQIASINSSSTGTEFAWHGAAGLSARLSDKTTFSVGYNYFDGGNIPFPGYIDSSTSSPSAAIGRNGVTVTPWKGKLSANEVFAELRIRI